jgi:predicted esterase
MIPSWAKDPKNGAQMCNARAETVAEKNSFKNAYRRRRCLIPADGFYEWRLNADEKTKQPFYILHSPQDFIKMRFPEAAQKALSSAGAKVKLTTYQGGHGWHGDPRKMIRTGMTWLESQSKTPTTRATSAPSTATR